MTIRMAENTIRLLQVPQCCSACGNQAPAEQEVRYVDFDAACDRGYGNAEAHQIALDDLILCEGCIRTAALMVDMVDGGELAAQFDSLQRRYGVEQRRADKAENYASMLEAAMDERPVAVSAPRRRGRPRKDDE